MIWRMRLWIPLQYVTSITQFDIPYRILFLGVAVTVLQVTDQSTWQIFIVILIFLLFASWLIVVTVSNNSCSQVCYHQDDELSSDDQL